MKKGVMILLICVAITLIAAGPVFVGTMSNSYDDMNQTIATDNPARVGVDVGQTFTAGISGLILPIVILILMMVAIFALWKLSKAAGGK